MRIQRLIIISRHEHLYVKLNKNIVPSSGFTSALKQLGDCQVILCTLSMLSNKRLDLFTNKVPMKSLVVDEASQIALSGFVYPLSVFNKLEKLSFIGDDKQCKSFLCLSLNFVSLMICSASLWSRCRNDSAKCL